MGRMFNGWSTAGLAAKGRLGTSGREAEVRSGRFSQVRNAAIPPCSSSSRIQLSGVLAAIVMVESTQFASLCGNAACCPRGLAPAAPCSDISLVQSRSIHRMQRAGILVSIRFDVEAAACGAGVWRTDVEVGAVRMIVFCKRAKRGDQAHTERQTGRWRVHDSLISLPLG